MKTRSLLLVFAAFSIFTLAASAADWPQWRGPTRTGVSNETGLLKAWPTDGPKLLWQINDIGKGYGTPAVVGDRIYLISNEGLEREFVQALAVADGKQVWSTPIDKVGFPGQKPDYTGARSTPTVDGDSLYAFSSDGDLVCLDLATGKPRWQKNVRVEFEGQYGLWAYAESPLIDGDVLVCTPGGKTATLLAFNKKTGAVIWKTAVPDGDTAGYASVTILQFGGRKQYVQFLKKGLIGVDAADGKILWRYGKTADLGAGMNMQTPIANGGLVYSASKSGAGAARLKADNGSITAEEGYFERNLPNAIGGAVLVDGHLYGTGKEGLICADFATGTIKWTDKCIGPGSICCVDGHLYVHGENGQMALVEATSTAYREKGRFTPPQQPNHTRGAPEKAWTYPVVANGRLYIHDLGTLWCFEVSGSPK